MRVLLILLAFVAQAATATEVSGVKFPERVETAPGQALLLNGAGLRKRAFFEVYAMGLYLPAKKALPADVLALPGAKRVSIHMLRDVGAEQFTDALSDGLQENHAEAEFKALQPRMAQLAAVMAQVKEAKKGMHIALDWVPGVGTRMSIDGKPAGAPIAGEDFYRALLRIWLGDKPVSADLKKALLGAP